jgi:hypothetical protein
MLPRYTRMYCHYLMYVQCSKSEFSRTNFVLINVILNLILKKINKLLNLQKRVLFVLVLEVFFTIF